MCHSTIRSEADEPLLAQFAIVLEFVFFLLMRMYNDWEEELDEETAQKMLGFRSKALIRHSVTTQYLRSDYAVTRP